ncbi:LSU ribosomal protein L29p (L35e) [hydrothermal vent metagenome]|uniref:Large ribosomal subunit protein uL29 n=1 Tax=hydrothermal vent metagenome TaxID=652676 RepID=A0A3B1C1C6_9ZZZZ
MKFSEIKELSVEELENRLDESKGNHMKLRFQHATAQLDNTAKIRDARRSVAKIETLINQRRLEEAKAKAEK